MARKNREEEVKAGLPEWMATYGDLVTLLLCFFVLLFSMSSVDAKKFEDMAQSLQMSLAQGSPGVLDGQNSMMKKGIANKNGVPQSEEEQDFNNLEKELDKYLKESGLEKDVLVRNEIGGLLLRFQDNVLFESGKADLKPKPKETLVYVSNLLKNDEFKDKLISVEGHTDNDPIRNSSIYPTNWELSMGRASNVVRFLTENTGITPSRLSAAGYSEYHPIAPNDSDLNKAKNRRVDILIRKSNNIN